MKSERRHELQHNLLADSISVAIERTRPYAAAIVGVLLLIIVSVIAWVAWRAHVTEQAAEAWENMPGPLLSNNGQLQLIALGLQVPPEYYEQKVISGYGGTSAADWAVLYQAEYSLFMGDVSTAKGDKKVADQALNEALQRYEKIISKSDNSQWIAESAAFGKARTQETLGRVDDAITSYQDYNHGWPKGAFKMLAEDRIEALQRADVRKFYDYCRDWKPKESPKSEFNKLGGPLPENPMDEKSAMTGTGGLPSGSGSLAKPTSGTATVAPKDTQASAASTPKIETPKPSGSSSVAPVAPASSITAPAIPAPASTSGSSSK